jgi:acetylornithine/succinyldiaminopimelate/putrescine aminotransferase
MNQNYSRYVNPPLGEFLTLSGRDQHFVRAEGCALFTDRDEKYSDWVAGFGSFNLGHNPPGLRELIDRHLHERPPNLFPEAINPFAGDFAQRLVQAAGHSFETCFFANSGSEAVEAAIKTAITFTGRKTILAAENAYHGTTLGALSLMGAGHYREVFEPLLPYPSIPFNNVEALSHALQNYKPAAFIVEPIQVDGGMRIPQESYLQQASSLCHDSGCLMILDEVQTGMGRTGSLFAFQKFGMTPDILILGKSLGAGLVPVSAILMREGIFQKAYGNYLSCEVHNSTFGGNALACIIGMHALSKLNEEKFLKGIQERSLELREMLTQALQDHPLVSTINLMGLLGGITLREIDHPWFSWKNLGLEGFDHHPVTGPLLVHRMHKRKFLTQICAHDWNTLRIEPPLIVSTEECKDFASTLLEELNWIQNENA